MVTLTRKNSALLVVLLASAVAIFAGIWVATPHRAPTPESAQTGGPDDRPSPVAESVEVVTRARRAPEPAPQQPPQPTSVHAASTDTSKDWSVVAATLNSLDQAEKRADSLKDTWRECQCTVFPKGESERYFVVVGTGLGRNAADSLRDRATGAGLPGDTYVTKLIRRPGDPNP
ncbi:MAG: hypothetical protein SGI92_05820 [Bryobacteraceae bacterium]|nr:hypothetical protein [Bryobacteraceae bacterium]